MVVVCSPYGRIVSHSDPGYSSRVVWLEVIWYNCNGYVLNVDNWDKNGQ